MSDDFLTQGKPMTENGPKFDETLTTFASTNKPHMRFVVYDTGNLAILIDHSDPHHGHYHVAIGQRWEPKTKASQGVILYATEFLNHLLRQRFLLNEQITKLMERKSS